MLYSGFARFSSSFLRSSLPSRTGLTAVSIGGASLFTSVFQAPRNISSFSYNTNIFGLMARNPIRPSSFFVSGARSFGNKPNSQDITELPRPKREDVAVAPVGLIGRFRLIAKEQGLYFIASYAALYALQATVVYHLALANANFGLNVNEFVHKWVPTFILEKAFEFFNMSINDPLTPVMEAVLLTLVSLEILEIPRMILAAIIGPMIRQFRMKFRSPY